MDRLSDFAFDDLKAFLAAAGEPTFRSRQIWEWMFQKGTFDPEQMANVPRGLRESLKTRFQAPAIKPERITHAKDLTDKVLFRLADGQFIESVMIPAEDRTTICLSSQVGCAVRCRFCASGLEGGKRNLSRGEILEQFLLMKMHTESVGRTVTNLVMMGMGEPMFNYQNVMAALETINSAEGPNLGARRITVSTVGIRSGVERFTAAKTQYTLAFSLHAPNDEIRAEVVPLRAAMSVDEIRDAAMRYLADTGREVTFEYVLLDGINASVENARELAERFEGVRGTVNLIPYNPVAGLPYKRPPDSAIEAFAVALHRGGMKISLRRRRGHDIAAACGQLAMFQRVAEAAPQPAPSGRT
jgi:23S rRNA (adenine2503-C2)-methyltransferase